MNNTKERAVSLYLPFKTFIWCFHTIRCFQQMSIFILSFRYDCVYVCIVWFECFIIRMFCWNVFQCAWRGPWKNSLVLNVLLPCINIYEKKMCKWICPWTGINEFILHIEFWLFNNSKARTMWLIRKKNRVANIYWRIATQFLIVSPFGCKHVLFHEMAFWSIDLMDSLQKRIGMIYGYF